MLEIEGKNVLQLSKKFGTPLFVVCEEHLRENYKKFRDLFISHYPKTIVAYSYKTNYLPFICNVIKEEGGWAEVVSSLELNIAKKVHVDSKKIIFNGPVKTYQELLEAMKLGVRLINVDSLSELKKIILISKKYGLTANVGIRLNTSFFGPGYNKFGVNEDDALKACELISKSKNLKYEGLHGHLGSQITTTKPYKKLIKYQISISEEIYRKYNLSTNFIDVGGGFPVRELSPSGTKKIPKIEEFAEVICSTLKKGIAKTDVKPPFLVLEPGRAIVSSPIFLLLKVIATKITRNMGKIVFTDGGINILPLAEYFRYFKYEITPNVIRGGKRERVQIAGPLCMEEDLIGIDRTLSSIKEGDILVVSNTGAYTISLSLQFIKPRPRVVAIDQENNVKVVRESESVEDILKLDKGY